MIAKDDNINVLTKNNLFINVPMIRETIKNTKIALISMQIY